MKRLLACTIAALPLAILVLRAAPAMDSEKKALAVLNKAIEAHGGAKACVEMKGRETVRTKLSDMVDEHVSSVEVSWKPPEKLRVYSASQRDRAATVWIFKGDRAWRIEPPAKPTDKTRVVDEYLREIELQQGPSKYVNWAAQFARYKSPKYKLSFLGESKKGDQTLVGIRAVAEKPTKVSEDLVESRMREHYEYTGALELQHRKEKELADGKAVSKYPDQSEEVKKLKRQLELVTDHLAEVRKKLRPDIERSLLSCVEPPVSLYFDKETSLLMKRSYKDDSSRYSNPSVLLNHDAKRRSRHEADVDLVCEDYQEAAGIRYPQKITILADGAKTGEFLVTQFRALGDLDDVIFEPK